MQPNTQQGNQPATLPPVAPPVPPQSEQPKNQGGGGQSFYTPAAPPAYAGQVPGQQPQASSAVPPTISWEASEYVHTDKGAGWLIGFGAVFLVLLGLALWFAAWTFAILIVVMAVAMAIFAFRPPRVLHYSLSDEGVQINGQTFYYSDFRAFGVLQDGAFFTLTLIPVKRFAPALSVYFAGDHGEQIVDIVGSHLPMEHIEPAIIDTIMRRLRF